MHYVILVAVLQGCGHLSEQLLYLFLREPVIEGVDVLTHVHMLRVCDDIEELLVYIHVYELNDIRMVQLLEHLELANDFLKVRRLHLLLLDALDCYEHVQLLVNCQHYF